MHPVSVVATEKFMTPVVSTSLFPPKEDEIEKNLGWHTFLALAVLL